MTDAEWDFTPLRLTPWPAEVGLLTRCAVFSEALGELIWLDVCALTGFETLRQAVRNVPVAAAASGQNALALIRVAVRDACVCYPKRVHCLQRSAVVARMLRRRGMKAVVVVGCRQVPMEGHAWVELNGAVIWDNRPALASYRVIDRF